MFRTRTESTIINKALLTPLPDRFSVYCTYLTKMSTSSSVCNTDTKLYTQIRSEEIESVVAFAQRREVARPCESWAIPRDATAREVLAAIHHTLVGNCNIESQISKSKTITDVAGIESSSIASQTAYSMHGPFRGMLKASGNKYFAPLSKNRLYYFGTAFRDQDKWLPTKTRKRSVSYGTSRESA